jgi:hypothetical protein
LFLKIGGKKEEGRNQIKKRGKEETSPFEPIYPFLHPAAQRHLFSSTFVRTHIGAVHVSSE